MALVIPGRREAASPESMNTDRAKFALGKPGNHLGLVLVDAANKVVGHAQVQCPMLTTGEKINVVRQKISPTSV